ncbi:hypothetical protein Pan97_13650 [Bremerella volcania]|uniref:Uncharacterized protein n=1 Tax=Bremerella volcania TaxID=2527984 RepID=A0A518C554_9BACT|nr:hypothetical protein Pan97_13650 [Bremerella volcania]
MGNAFDYLQGARQAKINPRNESGRCVGTQRPERNSFTWMDLGYFEFFVTPSQSSVRNGVAGSPCEFCRFATGLSPQA